VLQFWTREVAKELVQYLANENRWEKYSWTQLELAKQREAAQDVNAHLQREKIPDVAIETIEKRLQKAIKDGQRSKHYISGIAFLYMAKYNRHQEESSRECRCGFYFHAEHRASSGLND
jgi:hypothetical protein